MNYNASMSCPRFSWGLVLLAGSTTLAAFCQQAPTPNVANPHTREDFQAVDEKRELYQRASDLVKTLRLSPGDWVADVGAGAGYYVMRLSEVVGPEGKVLAEDITDSAVELLNRRITVFDLRNVEVVKGDIDNPRLPMNTLAAVLVVDSYHHFEQHPPMLEQILRSLKLGGRLVIADYSLRKHRTEPRADQLKRHEIDPEVVRAELGRAGFEVVKLEDPFVKRVPEAKNSSTSRGDFWLILALHVK
jgi:ubiquinone/menaquinone biosynthesis C-methylase UbiE